MKGKLKIGVFCLAKESFDMKAAGEIFDRIKEELRERQDIEWAIWDKMIVQIPEAEAAAEEFSTKLLDGVVIISGTFHHGHIPLIINNYIQKPILLWALNELPYNGGKIRLNSVCGINLNASNMYKAGIENVSFNISDHISDSWIDAMKMYKAVSRAKLGLASYNVQGFSNISVADLDLYKYAGALVDHFELAELYRDYDANKQYTFGEKDVRDVYYCKNVTDQQVQKVAELARCFKDFMDTKGLDGLAVRCWPEFAATYGIAPCASMSYLQGLGYVIGCEGDLEGTLSMLACKQISPDQPFLADLSQVNFDEDYALMWHCGVAPYTLWDGISERSLDAYRDGGKGMTADFVMKNGEITIMRIDTAKGKTRVFMEKGTVIPMTKDLRGTYCKVKFEKSIREIIDTVTLTGIAHHVAMIYGDHTEAVKTFARIMGFEVIS